METMKPQSVCSSSKNKMYRSNPSDKYEEIQIEKLEVISYDESTDVFTEGVVEENDKAVENVEAILKPLRSKIPNATDQVRLFYAIAHPIASIILNHSVDGSGCPMTGQELCIVFAATVILNLSFISNKLMWSTTEALENCGLSFERFDALIRVLRVANPNAGTFHGQWLSPSEKLDLFQIAFDDFNHLMGPFRRRFMCLGNGIQTSSGIQALKDGETAPASIKGDGVRGFIFDMCCDSLRGVVCWISLRGSGGGVPNKFLSDYTFYGGETFNLGRYYSSESVQSTLSSKVVSSMGPLKGNLTRDHCFDVVSSRSHDAELPELAERRAARGIVQIHTFPCVGPMIRICRNVRSKVLAIGVLFRNGSSASDGVIKFMVGEGADSHDPMCQPDYLAKLVAIPLSIPCVDKASQLLAGVDRQEVEALEIMSAISSRVQIDTDIKRDAAWEVLSKMSLTASVADGMVKNTLHHLTAAQYPLIRAYLSVTVGEDDAVDEDDKELRWVRDRIGTVDDADEPAGPELEEALASADTVAVRQTTSQTEEDDDDDDSFLEQSNIAQNSLVTAMASSQSSNGPGDVIAGQVIASASLTTENELLQKNMIVVGEAHLSRTLTADETAELLNQGSLKHHVQSKLPEYISGGKLYSVGFMRSLQFDLQYLACSPDALCLLTERFGNVPCLVALKTSMSRRPTLHDAHEVHIVMAGSAAFQAAVPVKFRIELLHGVATLGIKHALLVQAVPSGVQSNTLVEFEDGIIEEYLDLVKHKSIAACFSWFHPPALRGDSDAAIIKNIPNVTPKSWRRLIASHVPAGAAVRRYRVRLPTPIPPVKLFRFNVVNLHEVGKAPCDSFCKTISELMSDSQLKLGTPALLAIHSLYTCFVNAMNLHQLAFTWKNLRREIVESRPSLRELKRKLRAFYKTNDQAFAFARELLRSPVPLGMDIRMGAASASQHLTADEEILRRSVVAADKDWAWRTVRMRAEIEQRLVKDTDFISGAPVHKLKLSTTTPEGYTSNDKYLAQLRSALHEFEKIVLPGKLLNIKRLEFWNSESGMVIRGDSHIIHMWLPTGAEQSVCFLCSTKGSFSRTTAAPIVHACGFCGEHLCDNCKFKFHSKAQLEIQSDETSSSAMPSSTTISAATTRSDMPPASASGSRSKSPSQLDNTASTFKRAREHA